MTQTPQVLIDCQVVEQPEEILLAWDSREAMFPPALIEQAFEPYCSFINRLIEEGEGCMQQVRPVSLPATLCHARQYANASCKTYPAQLLHQGIVAQAERRPEAIAVIDERRTELPTIAGTCHWAGCTVAAGGASAFAAGCHFL